MIWRRFRQRREVPSPGSLGRNPCETDGGALCRRPLAHGTER